MKKGGGGEVVGLVKGMCKFILIMDHTSMQVVKAVKPSAIFVAVQNWLPTTSNIRSLKKDIIISKIFKRTYRE